MRITIVAMAICVSVVSLARADDVTAAVRKPVNIPSQPLGLALQSLARECDRQVLYRSEVVGAYRSIGLSGELTFDEALQKLLDGTSLTYRYLDEKTVTIDPTGQSAPRASASSMESWSVASTMSSQSASETAPRSGWFSRLRLAAAGQAQPAQSTSTESAQSEEGLDTVVVTANGSQVELVGDYAGGQVARGGRVGLFGNLDIMDTPFNFTNYTAEFMRNLQARSVADVAQADPGVRVARGFGNFQELYVVRGFPVYSDDMSYNGLYGLLPRQYVAAEFLERVEIFRGANSFLNGAAPGGSGIGGSFNLVPKRAPSGGLTRFTAGIETGGEYLAAGDVARRFGSDGQFGMRVNAVRRDGDTAVDDEHRKLSMASLGMDYRGERARLSADFGWQDHHIDSPRPSVTPFGGIPKPPKSDSNFAQDWTFTAERDFFGVVRGEYDFSENGKVWAATGLRDGTEHNILANPTSDANGNASSYRFDNYREDRITTSEVGVRGEFKTGPVGHRLSASASIFKLDSKNAYAFSSFFTPFAVNLYDFVSAPAPTPNFFTGGVLFDPLTTTLTKTSSQALADILSFNEEKVLLILGVRNQKIEQSTYNYDTGARQTHYDKSAVTPVFGIVGKLSKSVSVYGNYAEALIQGAAASPVFNGVPVVNGTDVLSPFRSKQVELGVKYDSGTFGGTASAFRTTQPTAIVTIVGNQGFFGADGEQLNRGLEFSMYGQASERVRLLGGATFLNVEAKKTQSGLADGNRIIGVPKVQLNVGADWDVPALTGLTVDGRLVYTSNQAASVDNTLHIPSWTRFDIGSRYTVPIQDKNVTFRLRVDNVTDKKYWASVGGSFNANYMVLGGPRLISFSASVDL